MPPYQPQQPAKRPWWRALWVLPLAALIIGVAIGVGAAGSSKAKNAAATPGPTVFATVSTTATATQTVTNPGPTVTEKPTIVKVVATRTQTVRVTYTPPPPKQYPEGTYVVGTDIQPGYYHTAGSSDDDCYWARLHSLDTSDIIDNNDSGGPQTVQVKASDKAFQVGGDCTFGRIKG